VAEIARVRQRVEACLETLRRGDLSEAQLQGVLEAIDALPAPRQDLIYMQTGSTSVASGALGMALVRDGVIVELPDDPKEWPYRSPLEAMRDGWRVIQFPNLALMMDESRTYGLGCEFILERWR
jgi:hypothetical protein